MSRVLSLLKPVIEKFPVLASVYRQLRDERLFQTAPAVTPWGFKLAGNPLMASGEFEPEETKQVQDLLAEVDILVNIGANIGYYCCHALNMGKEVIAIEPMQDNIKYLCKNIEANGWSCEIYPIALSKETGVLKMYGAGTGASLLKGWAGNSEKQHVLVPCSTSDILLTEKLRNKKALFILDVEGAEYWVLQGSSKILANNPKPIWLIEIAIKEQQPKGVNINPLLTDTFQLMFDAGYEAFTADSNNTPVSITDVLDAQREMPSVLDTTHNFIFR